MTKLIWVYPPDNWQSKSNKTFVYGWCNPRAKLFVHVGADLCVCPKIREGKHIGLLVQIFPNGNFAKVIKLPKRKNVVRLVQILNDKRKIVNRNIYVKPGGADLCVCPKIREGEHIGSPLHFANLCLNLLIK